MVPQRERRRRVHQLRAVFQGFPGTDGKRGWLVSPRAPPPAQSARFTSYAASTLIRYAGRAARPPSRTRSSSRQPPPTGPRRQRPPARRPAAALWLRRTSAPPAGTTAPVLRRGPARSPARGPSSTHSSVHSRTCSASIVRTSSSRGSHPDSPPRKRRGNNTCATHDRNACVNSSSPCSRSRPINDPNNSGSRSRSRLVSSAISADTRLASGAAAGRG